MAPALDLGLSFTPVTLTFKDLWYSVTLEKTSDKLDLLQVTHPTPTHPIPSHPLPPLLA